MQIVTKYVYIISSQFYMYVLSVVFQNQSAMQNER
jgi:hypothetical protein